MRAVQGVCINYYVAHSYVAERSFKIVNCLHLAIAVLSIELHVYQHPVKSNPREIANIQYIYI